ncbi:MAG: sulfoxide reductase heme-binding subunit YedZ [Candidatus Polarisedimenticolaceae bacterium]|nr:sulfoxide reductase heme-binding subunit YedZ [Candidatus Polarisedimenticolaceae bacterium]
MPAFLIKSVVFLLCLSPAVWLAWQAFNDQLGANPVEVLTHQSGLWTLRFLLLTLAITPLRTLSGWRYPGRLRRMFGLYTFFYALLHFLIYLALDRALFFDDIWQDIAERPYIMIGFTTFLMLLPLAITSNNRSMKRLGKRWKQLHRLVYLCGLGGVLHYLWLVKADLLNPAIYLTIFLLLMLLRIKPITTWLTFRRPSLFSH